MRNYDKNFGTFKNLEEEWSACHMVHLGVIELTCLCVSLTHTLASAASALDSTQHAIDETGSTPFLMRQNIHTKFFLSSLN
jgi:hypothetical protein